MKAQKAQKAIQPNIPRRGGLRPYLAALAVALAVCALTWAGVFWVTGDRIDCDLSRPDIGAFCALKTQQGAGVSVQWSGGVTVWLWGESGNSHRLWPSESGQQ